MKRYATDSEGDSGFGYSVVAATNEAGEPDLEIALLLLEKPVDEAISEVLAHLGQRADVDRAWMFEYDAELLRFRNTHEWCRPGIIAHVTDLQDAPVAMIGWLHAPMLTGQAVLIHDVAQLPRPARALRAEMLRQGDISVICVPVLNHGRLRACIGFDMVRAFRRWADHEVRILTRSARLIAAARYGRDATPGYAANAAARPYPLIYLQRQGGVRGVMLDEIIGLRSARDYTHVWLTDGSVVLDTRSIGAWAGLLPEARFPRIHRTAIVNLLHIADLDRHAGNGARWEVRLKPLDHGWAVSRPYRKLLRARLGV